MHNILLVEDNPIAAYLVREAFAELRDWPTEISWVNDGEKALSYLQSMEGGAAKPPALVILDMNLPKYDGLQVLAAFRASTTAWNTPIFLFSSSAPDEIAGLAASRQVRAEGYLQKPTGFQGFIEVANKLRCHVENSSSQAMSNGHTLEFNSYAT